MQPPHNSIFESNFVAIFDSHFDVIFESNFVAIFVAIFDSVFHVIRTWLLLRQEVFQGIFGTRTPTGNKLVPMQKKNVICMRTNTL